MTPALVGAVAAAAHRHGAPRPGESVLVMVSGGADSMFLLHALADVHDGPLHVLTCDHGLRPAAAAECALVEAAAAGLGYPATRVRLALEPGTGLQDRARRARAAAAQRVAQACGATAIALGHTADDLAETVLMRLARGAGPAAVHGMVPRTGALVRPLLDVRRAQTRAWCVAQGVAFVDDPSNDDPAYARVRARALLAGLEDVSPGATAHLARFARLARDEAQALQPLADAAHARARAGDGVRVGALASEPVAVQRRVLRSLLQQAGAPEDARGWAAVEAVRAWPPRVDLAGGWSAVIEHGVLRVVPRSAPAPTADAAPLPVPGTVRRGEALVRAYPGRGSAPTPRRIALHPAGPLTVRGPAPGDRLALPGGGHAAVGRMLAGARVPSRLRPHVPVVLAGDTLVWVAGHRAAAGVLAPVGAPATVLELEDL